MNLYEILLNGQQDVIKLQNACIDAKRMGRFNHELSLLKPYVGKRWCPEVERELASLHNEVIIYSTDEFERTRDYHLGRFHCYETRWLGCTVLDGLIREMDLFWVPNVKNDLFTECD